MSRLHVLRVFCGNSGQGGNPLGVFLSGDEVPADRRQDVAADLGFSETVFVEDVEAGSLRIFTPVVELPFAGHPTVGAAWLLASEGAPVHSLRVPAGELPVRYDGTSTYVAARPEWAPEFEWLQLESPAAVEALAGPPDDHDHAGVWAWSDEDAGAVRARVFPRRYGIDEDEATGSAVARLSAELGRTLDVLQGRGSRISARPLGDGFVEIGGTCVLDDLREYA